MTQSDDLIERLHVSADACEYTTRSKLLYEAADALAEARTTKFSIILHILQDALCHNPRECRECECLAPALTTSITASIRALFPPASKRKLETASDHQQAVEVGWKPGPDWRPVPPLPPAPEPGLDPGEPRRCDDGNQGSPVKFGAPLSSVVPVTGLFANILHDMRAKDRRGVEYYEAELTELQQHIKELVQGKRTLQQFAEHWMPPDENR